MPNYQTIYDDSAFQTTSADVLPDNSIGSISAQDMRDLYATVRDRNRVKSIVYSSTASLTIDLSSAIVQTIVLTQNIGSVSFANCPAVNLFYASEDITNAAWDKASNATVSASNVENVEGLSVADRLTWAATTNTTLRQPFQGYAGAIYTLEIDAKATSAAAPMTFNIGFGNSQGAAINVGTPLDVSASTTWGTAYAVSYTAATTQTLYATIDNRTNTVATDIYLSRLRLYPSSAKGDYVKTRPSPAGEAAQAMLYLKQDATGSRTVAWGPRIFWENSATPTLSTTAGAVDAIALASDDGGATWQATLAGKGWRT
jgi:hypothetical protein